jgi:hypothetical protein
MEPTNKPFMAPTRRQFIVSALGVAVAGPGLRSAVASESAGSQPTGAQSPADGSGHFGAWFEDEFGLPAYRYTCNQNSDAAATTPVTPGILGRTEHIHQVGNDRITAIVSNFGHVRVRQDEGVPKFLNDFDPTTSQFGGGFGYLTDGNETLSTYYDGRNAEFERIFGAGYYRKRVSSQNYSIDQTICAPFGDDPVLLSQVTIQNRGDAKATVRWIEYWGCQPYQFSFRAFIESFAGLGSPVELRRQFGRLFSHKVSSVNGLQGLLETKEFTERAVQDEAVWQRMKEQLKAHPNSFLNAIDESTPGTGFDSTEIPPTFLISLDAPTTAVSTDGEAFFGAGGPSSPEGLDEDWDGLRNVNGPHFVSPHTALLLERTLDLAPGEKRTLSFLYGYLPEGFKLDDLIAKYKSTPTEVLPRSSAEWKSKGMRLDVASEPWVKREAEWNHYLLRSSLTYDDFFGEHILNQNGFYEYVMGFQGAARDPLQHCLPFTFSDPQIVKSVLRYTLKEVRDDGSIPYAIVGHGQIAPMTSDYVSDIPLWLLWAASEYVLATRDVSFLDEQIPAKFSKTAARTDSVRNLLARCFRHQAEGVGTGTHGLVRMLMDDWNDGLISTYAQPVLAECVEQGESVLNTAMSAWVFDFYASMLRFAGDGSGVVEKLTASAEQARTAARAQWTGKWFKRAWMGPTMGWIGESTLWIEPQPWAILSRVTSPEQTAAVIQSINELLRTGPLGAAQMSDGPDMRLGKPNDVGSLERGAIWPSLNQTLVWALAGVDPAMAWDEWKKNSFRAHANAYPDIWYGIWSGPDSWNSPLSKHPGATANDQYFHGTDFPVLNVHSHACFLYSAVKLLGIEFTESGFDVSPELAAGEYRFESPLLGVSRAANGKYEGWYAPSQPGRWTIQIQLPEEIAKKVSRAEVNGVVSTVKRIGSRTIALEGASEAGKPLRWALS